MADEMPEPITVLAARAAELHEMYLAFQNSGFTEAQAFDLVKTMVTATIRGGSDAG